MKTRTKLFSRLTFRIDYQNRICPSTAGKADNYTETALQRWQRRPPVHCTSLM